MDDLRVPQPLCSSLEALHLVLCGQLASSDAISLAELDWKMHPWKIRELSFAEWNHLEEDLKEKWG